MTAPSSLRGPTTRGLQFRLASGALHPVLQVGTTALDQEPGECHYVLAEGREFGAAD